MVGRVEDERWSTLLAFLIAHELEEEHPLLRVEAAFVPTLRNDMEVWVVLRLPDAFAVKGDSEHLTYGKLHSSLHLQGWLIGFCAERPLLPNGLTNVS